MAFKVLALSGVNEVGVMLKSTSPTIDRFLAACLLVLSCASFSAATAAELKIARDLSPAAAIPAVDTNTTRVVKKGGGPLIGLALGGGGTRGAAHVPIIRELERNGIHVDLIVGTSMGAVVGGLYSAGVSPDTLKKKFEDRSLMRSFMTVPLSVRLAAAPLLLLPRALGYRPYDGLYKGKEFRHYLEQSVPPGTRNIEDLKIPFAAIALNIVNGEVERLDRGNLGLALQATSAVPGLRKPVQIGSRLFIDGGVQANVPVLQARAMGADFVIGVCVDERLKPVPLDTFRKVGSVTHRVVSVQLKNVDKPELANADVIIHPDVDGIGLLSTSRQDAIQAMAAGEKAVKEAIPLIKAKLAARGYHPGVAGTDNVH